ncbi:hypothetical protein J3R30DRAFT_863159 [Lentinula aciculospora]|uniref:REJ domain-containing protein n=1 Tax=Lentinula aciculospora TaxID=153920 RepID=A0A9W9AQ17_9AGAR|nr:hypothetical protein J3R30DRAFT_863159 [Lentinula aciculospora]
MVQLPDPIITPAPNFALLGRQYVQFRPRQTDLDSNTNSGVGASAGVSGDGNGDAGISVGASATDTSDTATSGQVSPTSGDGNGDGNTTQSESTPSSTSSTSSQTSSPSSTSTTSTSPTSTSSASSISSSQTSSSSSSTSSSSQSQTSTTSSSSSNSSSSSDTSSSFTSTSQSTTSSSSSTVTSSISSETNTSSVTFVTVITTEPDGSVSTFTVPSTLSSQSPNSKSSTARTAVIAGSTVGGVLFLILLTALASLFCWRRRKNRKLGFIEALTRRSKEGKGAGGVGLLDGEFDDDEEYRDELAAVHMRQRTISAHSPQPSVGAGSMTSLSDPAQNSANYPYNPAPTLYRARASDSGSMFHEEGVWPPPNHGTQFVDPFVPARELSKDSELGSIVDQIMGPNTSSNANDLPPGAAPAAVPGISSAAAVTTDNISHIRGTSGSSVGSMTPKRSSPLTKTLIKPDPPRSILTHPQTDSNIFSDAYHKITSSPLSTQPKNWLERQPKTPSPRNASLTLPPPLNLNGSDSSSAPPSAFANSASSLVSAYGAPHITSPPTSAGTQKHSKRVSWGDLPTPRSRPGSRQGSIAGGIGEAV